MEDISNVFGKFNLNFYLRSFIRDDIVEEYEENCLEIVRRYQDKKTSDVIVNMLSDFNKELENMGKRIVEETNNE